MTPIEAFESYVKLAGGRSHAATRLKISYGMVDHILNGRRGISHRIALAAEADSNGLCRREQLRPDIYPPKPNEAAA